MKGDPARMRRPTDGQDVRLTLDAWGRLELTTADGRRHVGVEPVRAFPISDPASWISFCDSQGREVLFLRSAEVLTDESRQVLEGELAVREFVPEIQRIVRVAGDGSPSDWQVETDRGPTQFTLDSEDDIRHIGPRRVLITDARKLRYQVPDTQALDGHSRRLLERFL